VPWQGFLCRRRFPSAQGWGWGALVSAPGESREATGARFGGVAALTWLFAREGDLHRRCRLQPVESQTPKAPWDQRLAENMARQSWEAANDPAQARKRPPLREQIKSPYSWVAMLAAACVLAVLEVSNAGWAYGLAAALYLVGLVASPRARRG
jgi:hypothetical protein